MGNVYSVIYIYTVRYISLSQRLLTAISNDTKQCFTLSKFLVFPRLFPGKNNEIPGQFGFYSEFVLIM